MVDHGEQGGSDRDAGGALTVEDLDRERLITYLDWADVRAPWWYWPTYAAVIAFWLAAYDLGGAWGTAGALAAAVVLTAMARAAMSHSGVSLPRFRGMPASLRRAFLPLVVAIPAAVAVVALLAATRDDPPYALLGLLVGPALALAGAAGSGLYRRAARSLAREEGVAR